ncbi:hypothetical protein HOLleu_37149 [Holothuria leucospilota]|uniref:Uncharacterized protein n=1 Tax=Holothuria leucospilota TaxID=206669 RepID=A0A9Q1BEJ6_HOLLE|nr:hypothetical protein HOLleu_37149 [Holothuria leucospilota]
MYSFGDSPQVGEQLPFSVGVAMVTSGGLLALTLILAACSFFRKLRGGGGGHGSQSEMYVEEFYSNPAFMELPFDGSCSKAENITHDTSMTEINPHVTEMSTSSHSPQNGSVTHPEIVVAQTPVPSAYQEEPQYYVQENDHASIEESKVNRAIENKSNDIGNTLSEDAVNGDKKSFVSRIIKTETVIVNPGALQSFKKDENQCYEVRDKENLENDRKHKKEFEGESDLNLVKGGDGKLESDEMEKSKEMKEGLAFIVEKEKSGGKMREEGNFNELLEGEMSVKEKTGSLNKRVRTSIDDSYISRPNGVTMQQVKKPKMSNEELPVEYSARRRSIGKKGTGVYRKRSKNSFTKVKKPFFQNRRKITQTEDKLAAEVIQNPFTG